MFTSTRLSRFLPEEIWGCSKCKASPSDYRAVFIIF